MAVRQRVTPPAGDQPTIERERRRSGQQQGNRKTAPEQRRVEGRIHRARDDQHDKVVDDLHDRDRRRIRRKGKPRRLCGAHAGPQKRPHRQRIQTARHMRIRVAAGLTLTIALDGARAQRRVSRRA